MAHEIIREPLTAEQRRLVAKNMGLVHKSANQMVKNSVNHLRYIDDLIQEGMIGLAVGVRMFDPSRGVRLSTYVYPWIKAYQYKYAKQYSNIVSGAANNEARGKIHGTVSLDAPLTGNDDECDMTWLDMVTDDEEEDPDLVAVRREHFRELREVLRPLVARLNKRELDILQNRLLGDDMLEDLGKRWGVTREAIRIAEGRVLRKVRQQLSLKRWKPEG